MIKAADHRMTFMTQLTRAFNDGLVTFTQKPKPSLFHLKNILFKKHKTSNLKKRKKTFDDVLNC